METPRYEDYEGLVLKHAMSFAATTGLPVEELAAEGRVYFTKALKKWDPSRGKFSTVLVWYLKTEMINWAQKAGKQRAEVATEPEWFEGVCAEDMAVRRVLFRDALSHLSEDGKMVARVVFSLPGEIADALRTSGDATILTQISRWLRKQGWKDARISRAYTELTALANSL